MSLTELKSFIHTELSQLDVREREPEAAYADIVRELKIRTLEAGFTELSLSLPIEKEKYAVSAAAQLRRVLHELEGCPAPVDGALLTVQQAADLAGVGVDTLLGWIHSKQLRAVNVGKGLQRGRYRIQASDLQEFLKFRSTKS